MTIRPRWRRPARPTSHPRARPSPPATVAGASAAEAGVPATWLLRGVKRPLIMAGSGGCQCGGAAELRAVAERTGIPVITTLHGKGAFPESHELSLGMSGMHGWVHVNRAIQECDVLFNVGGRFGERVTGTVASFTPRAQSVPTDTHARQLGRAVPTSKGSSAAPPGAAPPLQAGRR